MHQYLAVILQQFNYGKNSFIVLVPGLPEVSKCLVDICVGEGRGGGQNIFVYLFILIFPSLSFEPGADPVKMVDVIQSARFPQN